MCVCVFMCMSVCYRQLSHKNLVQLYGVVTKRRPMCIVTELMKNGQSSDSLSLSCPLLWFKMGLKHHIKMKINNENYVEKWLVSRMFCLEL